MSKGAGEDEIGDRAQAPAGVPAMTMWRPVGRNGKGLTRIDGTRRAKRKAAREAAFRSRPPKNSDGKQRPIGLALAGRGVAEGSEAQAHHHPC